MPRRARRLVWAVLAVLLAGVASRSDAQIFSQDPTVNSEFGETVHESMLAIGPQWVINFLSNKIVFHNKLAWGPPQAAYFVRDFVGNGTPVGICCDPVAYYDPINNRYVIATLGDPHTNIYLMVSNGGNPTLMSSWHRYTLSDPGFNPDYIGLGVSGDKIVVGWNRFGTGTYVYRVLDRASAYSGTLVERPTPITLTDAFYKPARNITSDNDIHLVAVSGAVLHRTITGPAVSSQPGVSAVVVQTSNHMGASYGPQLAAPPGTCRPLEIHTSSGQIADVYKRGNNIAVTWQVSQDYQDGSPPASAVRTVRFSPGPTVTVHDDFTIGTPGINYSFPSVAEDNQGTLFVGYDRLSPNEYPSSYMIARRGASQPSDLIHQSPELLVKAGTAACYRCKGNPPICPANSWGDYTSFAVDEFASNPNRTVARFAGGWTENTQRPSTAIGTLNADYGLATISGRIHAYSGGVEFPRAGARLELSRVAGGVGAAVATSDANGYVTFGYLPNGTYRLRTSWGAAVAREARAGTGGSGQTVISTSEIEIVVTGSQVSSGNEFVIDAQATPQLTAISPSVVSSLDPAFELTVDGADFRPYSVVRFNGRDKATTYVSDQRLTAQITHDDIAKPAWIDPYKVTVFTPGASGNGTSSASDLKSLEGFLVSIPTSPTQVIACPSGDAGRVIVSVAVKSSSSCGIDVGSNPPQPLTGLLRMSPPDLFVSNLRVWDAAQPYPGLLVWEVSDAGQLSGSIRTFTFDVGRISGCHQMKLALELRQGAKFYSWLLPDVEVRAFDFDPRVRGTVDPFDLAKFDELVGTYAPCRDFVPNGAIDDADRNLLVQHSNHYFPRQLFTPNGGGTYMTASTIPATWKWGGGDSAFVGFKLVDGGTTALLAANVPDDGEAGVPLPCGVPIGPGKKLEIFHHSGAFRMEGPFSGSDQSDGTFTVQPNPGCGGGGGGGCPYLATWVGGSWHEENSILSRSANGQATRDLYRLTVAPELDSEGRFRLRVREEGRDRTRLLDADVITVDRDPDQVSFADNGRIGLGSFVPVHAVRSESGGDLTAVLTDPRGGGLEAGPGEIFHVELFSSTGAPPSGIKPRLVFGAAVKPDNPGTSRGPDNDLQIIEQSGIAIERPDGDGGWVEVTRFHPRHSTADLSVEAGRELRLRFIGRHRIRALGWVRLVAMDPPVTEIAPFSATHNRLGDVGSALATGTEEIVLEPDEAVEMSFEARPMVVGKVRDYYFASRGYYGTPDDGSTAALPGELRLLPARPNPTTGDVSIGFDLPKTARVRIAVYDAAGRIVQRLVDGERTAGRHDVVWNLRTTAGKRTAAGVYFCRMEVGSWRREMKVTVK